MTCVSELELGVVLAVVPRSAPPCLPDHCEYTDSFLLRFFTSHEFSSPEFFFPEAMRGASWTYFLVIRGPHVDV